VLRRWRGRLRDHNGRAGRLARTRRSEGIGSEDPFHLASWSDGRLTLDDPATGRHLELEAFGSLNTEVFGRLLTAHGGTQ